MPEANFKFSTPDPAFWRGKRVLLTGHTGFKGGWAAIWLSGLGAEVTGLALPPDQTPCLFELAGVDRLIESHFVDLRDAGAVEPLLFYRGRYGSIGALKS